MNYLTDVADKNLQVRAITYGMLEAQKDGIATVVDLYAFYKILQWIKAANNFKNYGNSYTLLKDITNENVKKKIKSFSDAMNMNYIASLRESVKQLKNLETQLIDLDGPAALLIPNVIKDFLKVFNSEDKDYLFQAKLAKWHYSQERYAIATINLNEAIVNFVMDIFEFPKLERGVEENNYAKDWLKEVNYKCKKTKWQEGDKELLEYYNIYEKTRKMRNDIAHSLGEKISAPNDISNLGKYCDKILDLFKKIDTIHQKDVMYKISEKILKRREDKI